MLLWPAHYFAGSSIVHSGTSIYYSVKGDPESASAETRAAVFDLAGAIVNVPAESRVETIHSAGYRKGARRPIIPGFLRRNADGTFREYVSYDDLNPTVRLEMQSGRARVMAGPGKNLKPIQRASQPEGVLLPNEEPLKQPPQPAVARGKGNGWARFHPDTDIFGSSPASVFEAGEIPYKLEVAGRPFCDACIQFIEGLGGTLVTPYKAIF
jgi:hypothetical protein